MDYKNGLVWFRTEVLQDILQEQAKTIYYWRGKELAQKYEINDFDSLHQIFTEMGLGKLIIEKKSKTFFKILVVDSPLGGATPLDMDAISFECGLVTGAIQQIEKVYAHGESCWAKNVTQIPDESEENDTIEITITLVNE